ncbi:fimbrial protein [Aeromonas sp. 2HA2]|uniref:fimbrial protein n=1 Tax=Aeromonas sp. 2HA2 TaxID=2699194 RepID=UPI0023DD7931|nr:fimbrial protein [Aeromonas sp. 2HA2]MDF2409942.1 fimbrial protein [Aeromonas sp. 2HA2]
MMLTKHELIWVFLFVAAFALPWQVHAECRVISGPAMNLNYDYQRDRSPGSPDPIAIVQFETILTCDDVAEGEAWPLLVMSHTGSGYSTQSTSNIGMVNLLKGMQDSVGFVWRNSVDGNEKRMSYSHSENMERSLTKSGNTIRVHDDFYFYYITGMLQPGRDISPSPINVSYKNKSGAYPLYSLEFPSIPLFARSCMLNTARMAIDYETIHADDLRSPDKEPLPQLVRSQDLELVCDLGTNVGFRVTPAKQQMNNIMLMSDTLDSSAKGVGVKMRYKNMARSQHEVRFGETLHWGRTPETGPVSSQKINIPLEFYLVKTTLEVNPGEFEATATLEMRYE